MGQARRVIAGISAAWLVALGMAHPACAKQPKRAPVVIGSAELAANVVDQARLRPAASHERLVERGIATWYGKRHSKHFTVSGERFDPAKMTAAHRSLPIGTLLRVTDRDTGRSIVVRINDREPPHGRRIIDLSEGAARALGIHRQGVANVTLTAISRPEAVEVAEAPEDAQAPDQGAAQRR